MLPAGQVRIYLACGFTDMRKGFHSLAAQVQTALQHDPYSGALYIFRGRKGDLVKILFWDRQGMCLYAKKLDRGPLHLAAGQRGCGVVDHGPAVHAAGIDRLARDSVDGKARPGRLTRPIAAVMLIRTGTGAANRIRCRHDRGRLA
jgi:hypothetical protein